MAEEVPWPAQHVNRLFLVSFVLPMAALYRGLRDRGLTEREAVAAVTRAVEVMLVGLERRMMGLLVATGPGRRQFVRVETAVVDVLARVGAPGWDATFVERSADRMADRSMATIAAGALIGAGIGARLGNWWVYVTSGGSLTLPGLLIDSGKSVLGGLTGAYVGVLVTKRLIGYRHKTGDVFAPAAALGIAVGRMGCFLTEQIGTPTTLPWGFTPPPATLANIPNCPQCQPGVAMHPSFLYEIVFFAILFGVLWWLRPRLLDQPGELFKIFLAAYVVFRFAVEFVRGNDVVALGLTRSQWFLFATGPLIAWYFVRQVRTGAYRQSSARIAQPVVTTSQGGAP